MIKTENAAIKQFLEENKSLTYLIPILIVLIIVAIVVLSKSGKSSKVSSEPPDWAGLENGNQVIILPQTTRNIDDKESSVKKGFYNKCWGTEEKLRCFSIFLYKNRA